MRAKPRHSSTNESGPGWCCAGLCLILGAREGTLAVGEDPEDNVEHPESEGDNGGVSVE